MQAKTLTFTPPLATPSGRPLRRVSYFGLRDGGATMDATLTKDAPDVPTFPIPEGIVRKTGKAKGVVVFWSDVALHLRAALPASPELRADLRRLLDEADAAAVAAEGS